MLHLVEKRQLICVLCGNEFNGYKERPYCPKHQMVIAADGARKLVPTPPDPLPSSDGRVKGTPVREEQRTSGCIICGAVFEQATILTDTGPIQRRTCGQHRVDLSKSRAVRGPLRNYPIPDVGDKVWCVSRALHSVYRSEVGNVLRHYERGFTVRFPDAAETCDFNEVEWGMVSVSPVEPHDADRKALAKRHEKMVKNGLTPTA